MTLTPTDNAATLTISEMVVPQSLNAADAADFHAVVALNNAVCFSDTGLHDFARTPAEMLPYWTSGADDVCRIFVARAGTEIIGACALEYATAEPTSAGVDLMVLPQHWGHGVERQLLDHAEREARRVDRKVLQAWTLHRPVPDDDSLVPATGWGRISKTAHARLMIENGFALEQAERNSALDLQPPLDGIRRLLDDALAFAGPEYRILEWTTPTPPVWREGYAWALSRMPTDAPSGGLDMDEETWDVQRLARREQRLLDGGQTMSVVAVEHIPSGALAAFNELAIGADPGGVTHQYCTLVLREHRGHRLGMIVKCANILRWKAIAPLSPRISTFNAEENRPMLDINEALGFAAVSHAAAWQKRLS